MLMKDLHFRGLKGGTFNKRIYWKNTEGKDRYIYFEKISFFLYLTETWISL